MDKNLDIAAYLNIRPMKNMSDYLYQKISGMIMNGTLPEGYVFPNEAQLCEQLGVGRSTLREAYKALELTGYVTRSKRGGTVVNSQEEILAATPLKKSLENADKKDFDEFRLTFEIANAYGAAKNRTEEELQELKDLLAQMKAVKMEDEEEYCKLKQIDKNFHFKLAEMSHNDLFRQTTLIMSQAWDEGVKQNFFNAKNTGMFEKVFEQHEQLIEALEAADPKAAREVMRQHIKYVTQ